MSGQSVVFFVIIHKQVVHSQIIFIQPFQHFGILLLSGMEFLDGILIEFAIINIELIFLELHIDKG